MFILNLIFRRPKADSERAARLSSEASKLAAAADLEDFNSAATARFSINLNCSAFDL